MVAYRENYIEKLSSFISIEGKHVAVLGCGFGEECELLLHRGARNVDGFDIRERIGEKVSDRRIVYYKQSITNVEKPSNHYDIIFSAAVFEHVHGLSAAFREAERICKPGGLIFIISSPLWYSPYGNHMGAKLPTYPWCHLLYTPEGLRCELLNDRAGHGHNEKMIEDIVDRMYDPISFNRLPPQSYSAATASLKECEVLRDTFWPIEPKSDRIIEMLNKCIDVGYSQSDLCKAAHFFCASKVNV